MELACRAYSCLQVKSVDQKRRIFRGTATTPSIDRMGDVVNPLGIKFTNPVTLLHQHKHDAPIGSAIFDKPTKKGMDFEAEIPIVEEEGLLKDRVDLAWGEIKYGLVRATSIGFRALKYAFRNDGGIDYEETEVYELSPVSIPAQAEAIISQIKSMPNQLSPDIIRQIKRFDFPQSKGGIALVKRQPAHVEKRHAGVKLVKAKS